MGAQVGMILESVRLASCASSRVSSLASAYRPTRDPRLRLISSEHSQGPASSLDQPLVCEALASRTLNEAIEPCERVVPHIALIEPEGKFVDVAVKMLRAGVMVHADQTALHDSEDALHPVGGHVVSDVFAGAVVDRLMSEIGGVDACISSAFVGMQGRSSFDMAMNGGLDRFLVRALDRHSDCPAPALTHTENGRLADRAPSGIEFLGLMLVLFDATDIGLVNLDNALQHFELRPAGFTKTMKDEPCRFLRDPDFLCELHRRNALAGRHEQVHRVNPLMQRNVRSLEDGAGANREVLFALIAAIEAFLTDRDTFAEAADRAAWPVRPKATFKVGASGFLIGKHLEQLEGGDGRLAHVRNPVLSENPNRKERGSQVYNSHRKGHISLPVHVAAGSRPLAGVERDLDTEHRHRRSRARPRCRRGRGADERAPDHDRAHLDRGGIAGVRDLGRAGTARLSEAL